MINEELKESIDSRKDLLAEKQRLKDSIKMRKHSINGSFDAMRTELNPFSSFTKSKGDGETTGNSILSNIGSSPLVSMGVSSAANFLLKNFVLKRVGFIPRLLLPLVVKKASEYIVAPKLNNKIVSGMRSAADKIRETDVQDVLPDGKDLVPEKALSVVAQTSEKIAEKLHDTADRIRPDDKPQPLYGATLLKKSPGNKFAKKLHKLADKIRR